MSATAWWFLGGGAGLFTFVLFLALVGIIFALMKKKVDTAQENIGEVGVVLERELGLDGLKEVTKKLHSGNLIGARNAAKAFARTWLTPDKIDDLIARIITKALPKLVGHPEHKADMAKVVAAVLPKILDDKDTDDILSRAILERLLGTKLDDAAMANLVLIQQRLGEFGLDDTAAAILAVVSGNTHQARVLLQAIAADLTTEEGIRRRAKKVLRELVPKLQEVQEDKAWLDQLVSGNGPPPSVAAAK